MRWMLWCVFLLSVPLVIADCGSPGSTFLSECKYAECTGSSALYHGGLTGIDVRVDFTEGGQYYSNVITFVVKRDGELADVEYMIGQSIDESKIERQLSTLKYELADGRGCVAFNKFVNSLPEDAWTSTPPTDVPAESPHVDESPDAGTSQAMNCAQLLADAKAVHHSQGIDSAMSAYDKTFQQCEDIREGALALLEYAGAFGTDYAHRAKYYFQAYTLYRGRYPDIAEQAYFSYVTATYNQGKCGDVIIEGEKFLREYPAASQASYIRKIVNECKPMVESMGRCIPIMQNGDPATTLDVVFMPDGYFSAETFSPVLSIAHENLFANSIMKSSKQKVNTYYVKQFGAPQCDAASGMGDKESWRMCEYSFKVAKRFCPQADNIIVISRNDLRSYAIIGQSKNVLAENDLRSLPNLVTHEFGHSQFGLADEYTEVGRSSSPRAPNCAPDRATAQQWWGTVPGAKYYNGCSYVWGNIRPYENTVMRNGWVTSEYGAVSDAKVKSIMARYR